MWSRPYTVAHTGKKTRTRFASNKKKVAKNKKNTKNKMAVLSSVRPVETPNMILIFTY